MLVLLAGSCPVAGSGLIGGLSSYRYAIFKNSWDIRWPCLRWVLVLLSGACPAAGSALIEGLSSNSDGVFKTLGIQGGHV